MSLTPRILIFDSGVGGLSVAAAARAALPNADFFYAADSAAFPYGDWDEKRLVERICSVMQRLLEVIQPDMVVVACNTASTLALEELRKRCNVPFIGTVPAIKPAAEATKSLIIGVLATPGTVKREYTQTLIHTFAFHCRVFLHGATKLAGLAEAKLKGEKVSLDAVRTEIAPIFRRRGDGRTDVVVLGCTHYPLLQEELEAAAPWPVTWIDPAGAIARRIESVLADNMTVLPVSKEAAKPGTLVLTSMRNSQADYLKVFAAHGFSHHLVEKIDV